MKCICIDGISYIELEPHEFLLAFWGVQAGNVTSKRVAAIEIEPIEPTEAGDGETMMPERDNAPLLAPTDEAKAGGAPLKGSELETVLSNL